MKNEDFHTTDFAVDQRSCCSGENQIQWPKNHNTFLFLSGRPSWSDYCLLISYWQVWLLWSPAWACRKAFSWPFRAAGVRLSWCFLLWGCLFRNLCCLCLLLLYVVLRQQNNNQALHWTHLWLLNAGIFSGSGTGLSWGWSSRICFDFSICIYFFVSFC